MSPVYLSVNSFCFQDFGLSLLSLFWILFQVSYVFLPHFFSHVGFYHVPSPAACFSVFSCHLTYYVWSLLSSGWKVLIHLYCDFCPPWKSLDHCRVKFSLLVNLGLCSGRWSWILSLWREVPCTVMLFGLFMGFVWLWAAYLLMWSAVFLICWRNGVGRPAPEFAGFWIGLGLSVEMVAFGRAFAN